MKLHFGGLGLVVNCNDLAEFAAIILWRDVSFYNERGAGRSYATICRVKNRGFENEQFGMILNPD